MAWKKYLLCLFACFVLGNLVVHAVGFDFPRGEITLVESADESYSQMSPQVDFDFNGNAHVVWEDDRDFATYHMYGGSVLTSGEVISSYRCFDSNDDPHSIPYIFKNDAGATQMFGFTVNTRSTMYEMESVEYDLTTLPEVPGMVNLPTNVAFGAMGMEYFDMAAGSGNVYYVYKQSGDDNLYIGQFDQSIDNWVLDGMEVTAPMDYRFINPGLTVGVDGHVYLIYDKEFYNGTPSFSVVARRTVTQNYITDGFGPERYVAGSPNSAMRPAIAVTGSTSGVDLKVAVTYIEYDPGVSQQIKCSMEDMGEWTMSTWGGDYSMALNGDITDTLLIMGPEIEYDADKNLYIVWTDDRLGYMEFFGNISEDAGQNFWSSDERFAPGISNIIGDFSMATGPNGQDLALAYIRYNGTYDVPMMLYSGATFFDNCDMDPALTGIWNQYTGVTVDYDLSYSYPGSYQFVNGSMKGTLLHEFSQEMQGRVNLQFYDTLSLTENFYVGLENANEKGVIRMLGVRNDTTQNYQYSTNGGVSWNDTGLPRTLGWHAIEFEVGDSGLIMTVESNGTSFSTGDATMTAFTTLQMEGGSASSPYNVDDIRMEAFPLNESEPRPIPTTTVFGLILLLGMVGVLIRRR